MAEITETPGSFEVNGTMYELRFNLQKMKLIEATIKSGLIAEMNKNNGLLSIGTLEAMFSLCLVESVGLKVVKQSQAAEMFEKILKENNYVVVNANITEKFNEDMGFLFPQT